VRFRLLRFGYFMPDFQTALALCPLIAILRGVRPEEAAGIGLALFEAGIRIIEVPMNSPSPLDSVRSLRSTLGERALVGVGTALHVHDVRAAHEAGAGIVLSPNFDPAVVAETVALGLISVPGVATPSEGFAALAAGAHALKLFPFETIGIAGLRAWRSVFAASVRMLPVGGIGVAQLAGCRVAGAAGAGAGSSIYTPGDTPQAVAAKASALITTWRAA
jgi:2-dehydro-3-deoxyphosphogalactonate aldolase